VTFEKKRSELFKEEEVKAAKGKGKGKAAPAKGAKALPSGKSTLPAQKK